MIRPGWIEEVRGFIEATGGACMRKTKLIIVAVLAILVLIVIFQNLDAHVVRFLFWSGSLPSALMLVITLAAGFVIGIITTSIWLKNKDF
jgi:uncharacterized integral membrane protein